MTLATILFIFAAGMIAGFVIGFDLCATLQHQRDGIEETPDDEWVERLRKAWNECEAAPLCHWCGQELQIVRPGHTQCVNPECKYCNKDAVLYDVEGRR